MYVFRKTEDHPLDYASFEGLIPRGEYGAGEVIVWDNGSYSPDEGGRLSFDDRAEAEARVLEGIAGDPALNLNDGLHPNPKGVGVIVEHILPAVEKLLRSVAAPKP